MELHHFSHRHPLILNEDLKIDDEKAYCRGCWEGASGANYSCKECYFVLHKSCAELPRELQHPLHPKHPLILLEGVWSPTKCDGCNGYWNGFTYYCSHCKFNLEPKCASLPLTIEAESHDHPLALLRRSLSFTCDACGKEGKCMSYFCVTCSFMVHLECARFPLTLRHIRHKHPLKLTYSLQVNQSDPQRICQLCVKKLDANYGVYYCSSCDFVAHLHCATKKEDRDETFVHEFNDQESIESLTYIVKTMTLGEGKSEIVVEIKHFSHEHDLKLMGEMENNEKCDGCVQYIFPDPFYSCIQCKFFLHKSCAELPKVKRHSLHKHPLMLLPKASYDGSCFNCNACGRRCNGFTYNCDNCDFDLDVQCSLISDNFTHSGHEHRVILSSTSDGDKCSLCDFEGKIFRCADCEFTMDFKCATLPRTIKYRDYEQPFILSYTVEDDSGEYYCDICEEKRDPKQWFYYCADLSFPAHPKCILGEFPCMKFGSTYTDDIHKHPLTFVRRTKDHPPCDRCGSYFGDFAFECVKCNFNLHRWCLKQY